MKPTAFIENSNPFPTYFVSHGSPTFLYETDPYGDKGARQFLRKWGKNLMESWKPDYLIVLSAHWQADAENGPNLVEIAVPKEQDGENELIYDFYGFPNHLYQEKFRSRNPYVVSHLIEQHLVQGGFKAKLTQRGIDHGVWVPLKVAFDGQSESKLLNIPLVQVSLLHDANSFDGHARLGQLLDHFRRSQIWDAGQERYLKGAIICSGMSVHNLRDLKFHTNEHTPPMPYTVTFSKLLHHSLKTQLMPGELRIDKLKEIEVSHLDLLYQAHPTLEHFIPLAVAAGTNENVERVYNSDTGSFAWGIYKFGEDPKL